MVRVTLSSSGCRLCQGLSRLSGCVQSGVIASSVCCMFVSRIRCTVSGRRLRGPRGIGLCGILGKVVHLHGISVCMANDGSGLLARSIVATFHNENSRIRVFPLSFGRCCRRINKSESRTCRVCTLCNKVPRVLGGPDITTGASCLRGLFASMCFGSVGRHCGVHLSSMLISLASSLYSSVKSLAGTAGVTSALGHIEGTGISSRAVTDCLRCLARSFLFSRTGHCSMGKGGCFRCPGGCCYISVKLQGTHLGFHRRRRARVVRGVVCGRLVYHRCSISIKIIRVRRARGGGEMGGRYRVSFIMGEKSGECCVRSTLSVDSPTGLRARHHPLGKAKSGFGGMVVAGSSTVP